MNPFHHIGHWKTYKLHFNIRDFMHYLFIRSFFKYFCRFCLHFEKDRISLSYYKLTVRLCWWYHIICSGSTMSGQGVVLSLVMLMVVSVICEAISLENILRDLQQYDQRQQVKQSVSKCAHCIIVILGGDFNLA